MATLDAPRIDYIVSPYFCHRDVNPLAFPSSIGGQRGDSAILLIRKGWTPSSISHFMHNVCLNQEDTCLGIYPTTASVGTEPYPVAHLPHALIGVPIFNWVEITSVGSNKGTAAM